MYASCESTLHGIWLSMAMFMRRLVCMADLCYVEISSTCFGAACNVNVHHPTCNRYTRLTLNVSYFNYKCKDRLGVRNKAASIYSYLNRSRVLGVIAYLKVLRILNH